MVSMDACRKDHGSVDFRSDQGCIFGGFVRSVLLEHTMTSESAHGLWSTFLGRGLLKDCMWVLLKGSYALPGGSNVVPFPVVYYNPKEENRS